MTTPEESRTQEGGPAGEEDGGPADEVERLQRQLDVANDLGPADGPAEDDPPV